MNKSLLLLINCLVLYHVSGYNFFISSPAFAISHMKFMGKIADTLADAGHNVTFFQPHARDELSVKYPRIVFNSNVKVLDHYLPSKYKQQKVEADNHIALKWINPDSRYSDMIMIPKLLTQGTEFMCTELFQNKSIIEMLKRDKYDVFITEMFDGCSLYMADYAKVRSIITTFSGFHNQAAEDEIGVPSSIKYTPAPPSKIGKDSNVFDRIYDIYHRYTWKHAFAGVYENQYEIISKIVGKGKIRHWKEIMKDVGYHFSNSNPYFDYASPTIERVVNIGGFTMNLREEPKELPQKYKDFIGNYNKVVFISFGSMIKSSDMPNNYKQSLLQLFKDSPECAFIWKYENLTDTDYLNQMPQNVLIDKWHPQDTLLRNPLVNLFITHGGLGSIFEAAYSAKPCIVVPLFAEQAENAKTIERHGSAIIYDKMNLGNSELLKSVFNEVLMNSKYSENAIKLAEILNNPPIDPKKLVVKYSETIARFGKLPSLIPEAIHLNFIEYYFIDVAFVILLSILMVFLLVYFFLKMIIHCFVKNFAKHKSE